MHSVSKSTIGVFRLFGLLAFYSTVIDIAFEDENTLSEKECKFGDGWRVSLRPHRYLRLSSSRLNSDTILGTAWDSSSVGKLQEISVLFPPLI